MDQAPGPLAEGQMIREAAFKQYADAMMTGNIGRCHQRDVFRRAHMAQVIGLCQNKKPSRLRGLDFRKLLAKVLHKNIV